MLVTSSAISSDGSRASAAGHREALQFAAGQAAGVAFGQPVEADLGEQPVHVGGLAGRQPPHDVVGDAGAQHLTLGVLHDHRGAAEPAEPDGAGPFDGARRWVRGPASISISVVLPEPLAPVTARCSPGSHAQRHRAERVVVGLGVAEADVVQPRRYRRDRAGVGRRLQLVHVGNPEQPRHHPRQRPPADEA